MLASASISWVERLRDLHLVTGLRVIAIIGLAWLSVAVIGRLIDRLVRGLRVFRDRAPTTAGETARAEQRVRTVGIALRSAAFAVIWLIALITVLGEVHVNVGAFVATATIVGGALAFGAQQIVRDLLAGLFLLTEDQYGVGDVVDLGLASGVVERVTLRITRLRDAEGRVWYVPHGQIERVANLSYEWANAVVDVAVPRDADLDAVRAELVALATEVISQPDIAPLVLAQPQVIGPEEVRDDRVVVRISVRARAAARADLIRGLQVAVLAAEHDGRLPKLPLGRFVISNE
ncbi:MAG: moderate conductance mechanosensitive channel [Acidimicrobiaceae bacterium]|nr:moderate conductance mechanosensitive channel [Acidimicrobiaceae bacterium]